MIESCIKFKNEVSVSDILTVLGFLINVLLAVWLVRTVQNNTNNKRVLKDHIISEIKDCREMYRVFIAGLFAGEIHAKEVTPWFKNFNMRYIEIIQIANQKYKIENDIFDDFILDLNRCITDSKEFTSSFKPNDKIRLKSKTKLKIYKLQQENTFKFNNIIMLVNDF